MKVLLVGGCGSIGSRYSAILSYLGIESHIIDVKLGNQEDIPENWDKAIIATPTDTHVPWMETLSEYGKPILCEKPFTKTRKDISRVLALAKKNIHMVSNYNFILGFNAWPWIEYDYYRTGDDGLYWDAIQLLMIDKGAIIKNTSPIWTLRSMGKLVPYREVEGSYVRMIKGWVADDHAFLYDVQSIERQFELVESRC